MNKKKQAEYGRIGGSKTLKIHGREHFSRIGKKTKKMDTPTSTPVEQAPITPAEGTPEVEA